MTGERRPLHELARDLFARTIGGEPEALIRSPGRVNLIGDHTDYSDGFVLPIAIDRSVWLAFTPRRDRSVRVWAEAMTSWTEFDLSHLVHAPGWGSYVQGVGHILQEQGMRLRGFDGVIVSDLPSGAGLSSSAALELAAARAFASSSDLAWDPTAMAIACQRAENEWVGMDCGIMDQLVCATGRAGHAMLIDCRSLAVEPIALPPDVSIVVLDTKTRRQLVTSAYNERRRACEEAARALGLRALRDADLEILEARRSVMSDVIYRRARHVITENQAVIDCAAALRAGDVELVGRLMNASHVSLRDDFEVSTPALDHLAALASAAPGAFGARMTGAGFGGSVVALVSSHRLDDFAEVVASDGRGDDETLMTVRASDGVAVVE